VAVARRYATGFCIIIPMPCARASWRTYDGVIGVGGKKGWARPCVALDTTRLARRGPAYLPLPSINHSLSNARLPAAACTVPPPSSSWDCFIQARAAAWRAAPLTRWPLYHCSHLVAGALMQHGGRCYRGCCDMPAPTMARRSRVRGGRASWRAGGRHGGDMNRTGWDHAGARIKWFAANGNTEREGVLPLRPTRRRCAPCPFPPCAAGGRDHEKLLLHRARLALRQHTWPFCTPPTYATALHSCEHAALRRRAKQAYIWTGSVRLHTSNAAPPDGRDGIAGQRRANTGYDRHLYLISFKCCSRCPSIYFSLGKRATRGTVISHYALCAGDSAGRTLLRLPWRGTTLPAHPLPHPHRRRATSWPFAASHTLPATPATRRDMSLSPLSGRGHAPLRTRHLRCQKQTDATMGEGQPGACYRRTDAARNGCSASLQPSSRLSAWLCLSYLHSYLRGLASRRDIHASATPPPLPRRAPLPALNANATWCGGRVPGTRYAQQTGMTGNRRAKFQQQHFHSLPRCYPCRVALHCAHAFWCGQCLTLALLHSPSHTFFVRAGSSGDAHHCWHI